MIRHFIFKMGLRWLSLPVLLHLLRRTARWLPRGSKMNGQNCLEESILAIACQARFKREMVLAIGVKKEKGNLLAHAWPEDSNHTVDEKDGFIKIGTL